MTATGFAIVGSGWIGGVIADALREVDDAELRLVVSRNPTTAAALADAHGAAWSSDMAGYLTTEAAAGVDVVVVGTPSSTHADIAVQALEAGRHVLVEKPLDITLKNADRIIEAERRTGTMVAVVSQHRFDRGAERLLAAARGGALGRLTSATASCAWWRGQSYYDSGPGRGTWALDGGGAAMTQGIHVIDLLVAAMGEPVEVFARTATLAHERIEVEDTAVAVVTFAGGGLATIHATTAAYPGVETSLRVHGDTGSAALVDDALTFWHVADDPAPQIRLGESGAALNQVTAEDAVTPAERGLGPAHAAQLRDLVRAVRARAAGDRGARPRVGSAEGRRVLALVLGMYESARTGRPVPLHG